MKHLLPSLLANFLPILGILAGWDTHFIIYLYLVEIPILFLFLFYDYRKNPLAYLIIPILTVIAVMLPVHYLTQLAPADSLFFNVINMSTPLYILQGMFNKYTIIMALLFFTAYMVPHIVKKQKHPIKLIIKKLAIIYVAMFLAHILIHTFHMPNMTYSLIIIGKIASENINFKRNKKPKV